MSKNGSQGPTPVKGIAVQRHSPKPGIDFQQLRRRISQMPGSRLLGLSAYSGASLYHFLIPTAGFVIVADYGPEGAEVYRLMTGDCADELADKLANVRASASEMKDDDFDGDHANEDQKGAPSPVYTNQRAAIQEAMVNAARGPHMPAAPVFNPQDEDGLPVVSPAMTDEELEEKYNDALGQGRH